MARRSVFRVLPATPWLAAVALSLSLVLPAWLDAQDAPAAPRAKPRGRLPSYYARVVTPQQKEQVYSIQGEYEQKIDALEAQIVALEKQRDEAIRSLLTPEQRKQIDELSAAAEAKRAERKAKEEAEEQETAGAAAAKKTGNQNPGKSK